jgi:hypothetical protein
VTVVNEVLEAEATCWECGYALRGLASRRCPECGRAFDPADPTTMNTGQTIGPVTRWLMSPPGWPMYLLLAAAVLVSLWACVVPTRRGAFSDVLSELLLMPPDLWWRRIGGFWWDFDMHLGRFLLATALWTALIAAWIVRRVARGVTVRRVSRQKPAAFAYWRRWLVVPVVFGVTVLVCMTRLPTYAGFWVSKPWLERAAREAAAARGGGLPPPRVIGVFGRPVYIMPGTFQVQREVGQTHVHLAYETGLVRVDDGSPPLLPARQVARRLSANWFLVEPDRVSN